MNKATLIGIDLAKDIFQVCGVDKELKVVFNRTLKRGKLVDFVGRYPGVDIAMEAVGITATVTAAIESVRKGGHVGLIGNLAQKIEFPLQLVVTREITLFGSCASAGEYPQALQEIAAGRIRVEPLTSAIRPLSEGADWFQRLYDAKEDLIKVILQP